MKKRLLILSLCLSVGACTLGLTACGHTHSYTDVVTAPTCTEQGYTTHTCECGDVKVDTYVEALDHSFTDYVDNGDLTETAVCDNDNCEETDTRELDGLKFNTLTFTDKKANVKVSNNTETYSFVNEITKSGRSSFIVSLDELGIQTSTTKIVPLNVGDNKVYIFEIIDGDVINTYEVTIRRRPMHTVTFNTQGSSIDSQTIEEDSFAVSPETNPTRAGYTFDGWDFDFDTAITDYTTIDAKWKINQYTLTIKYGNGQEDKVITQDYNTPIGTIADPNERGGYGFIWDKTIPTVMPAYDLTITAQFKAIFTLYGGTITGLTEYGRSLTEIVIPNEIDGVKITSIGEDAFYECELLTSVVIGDSVTSIGHGVFLFCSSLTSVVIGNSVTSIANYAFCSCTSLTSVTIGDGVESIGYYAFSGCDSLTKTNYTGTIDQWAMIEFANGDNPIYYSNNLYINDVLVTKVNLSTATYISDYAFSGCDSLTSVTIPDSVKSIGVGAFSGCDSLTSVTIDDSVESIGNSAFSGCDSLTSIEIPNSVESISNYAFRYCSSLTSVTIPDSVESIGYYAFSGCDSLTKTNYTGTIDQWAMIEFVGGYSSNPIYYSNNLYINDVLVTEVNLLTATYISDSAFRICDSLTSVTIGDSVESIGDDAFEFCDSLTSVTIGDSVTSIGNWAFYDCTSLTSVVIGDRVTSIGDGAFYNCSSLTSIEIPNSVESISNYAFAYCSSLKSVTIPDSVESIGDGAFSYCDSLTSVTIPDSVKSIGSEAFAYCSSLTSIIFNGTIKEWNAITKPPRWIVYVPATYVQCSNGRVYI